MVEGLGLYFSYAKGGLDTARPLLSTDVVVNKANIRWPVQDRRWGLTLTFPSLFSNVCSGCKALDQAFGVCRSTDATPHFVLGFRG